MFFIKTQRGESIVATLVGISVLIGSVFTAYFYFSDKFSEKGHTHSSVDLPVGAVVAFDLSDGCPIGWEEFNDAQGRFILGRSDERSEWAFRQRHGEAEHVLTIPEMPSHDHKYLDNSYAIVKPISRSGDGGHRDVQRTTDKTGGGQPHNNMPPYISLYWCKKLDK